MKDLDYRSAFITGASSGIGHGLSRWFAARGVKVYAAARRAAELDALAAEAEPGRIVPVPLDVTDTAATLQTIQRLDDESGGLDLVVANAGVGLHTSGKRLKWEDVEKTLQVNVLGAAATLSAVLPRMVQRRRGHLVGMSSLAGMRGMPKSAAYSGSKAFLSTFLEGLRVDLVGTNVKVTGLNPGFIRTPMTAEHAAERPFLLELDDAVERMAKAIVRGQKEYSFPWPLAAPIKVGRLFPPGLWDAVARKLG